MGPKWALIILFFVAGTVAAAPKNKQKSITTPTAKPVMDTLTIHKLYVEGDFDEAIERLDRGLKYSGPFSHQDSVFIFKHLGVMYTSKYETRELGKKFMMQLLEVEPTARIMDMYASDMIYMIFKNIQDEYDLAQMKLKRAQGLRHDTVDQNPPPEPRENRAGKSESGHGYKWVPWTVVAAIAVAGGTYLAVSMIDDEPETRTKENVVK